MFEFFKRCSTYPQPVGGGIFLQCVSCLILEAAAVFYWQLKCVNKTYFNLV